MGLGCAGDRFKLTLLPLLKNYGKSSNHLPFYSTAPYPPSFPLQLSYKEIIHYHIDHQNPRENPSKFYHLNTRDMISKFGSFSKGLSDKVE